ncbi:hypothetical protein FPOA_11882 [Fusarium poae]|uniref:Uncharacterized protein n=1 Tax=Fusarium poae TaxID=36050 RepID=A0A1B8AI48_FUSPO|nr:hypothetical protein FPOA_11882 [Fusarium poae]
MSSLTTLISSATATPTSTPNHGSHSDKIAIIGLTIGIVFAFVALILPCICFQGLAHWQQKREERKEARERDKMNAAVGRVDDDQRRLNIWDESSPQPQSILIARHRASTRRDLPEPKHCALLAANMSDSKVLPRMSTGDMNVMIVCFSAMIFVFFLAGVVYYTWKPSRNGDPAPVDAAPDTGAHRNLAHRNLAHDNLARPFDGSTATHRVMIWSDAPRRDSNTGCRLPIFQRRRETSLERNTIPLQSVPGRENPRNNAE